jgi:hypothetical protein
MRKKENPSPLAGGNGQDVCTSNNTTDSIAHPKPERKPGFWAVVPATVRYDRELPVNAKLLYGELSALVQAEGYCWAGNEYFARLYDLSADRVGRLLTLLDQRGYIRREVVRDAKSNVVTGRKIWLCEMGAAVCEPPGKNTDTSRYFYRDPPGKNNGENNINNNTIPPISPKGEDTPSDRLFENFWRLYPSRHGRKNGKRQAKDLWRRMKVNVPLNEKILAGLDSYLHSDEVQRGYAMDAVRWLRGRRWEDEVVQTDTPTGADAALSYGSYEEPLDPFSEGGYWDG